MTVLAIALGIGFAWLIAGAVWWIVFTLTGAKVHLLDFYFVWRWRK
jgi:hypothetical protein